MYNLIPILNNDICVIDGKIFKTTSDSLYPDKSIKSFNAVDGNDNTIWQTSNSTFPHFWKIDIGSIKILQYISIMTADDVVDILIKNFNIEVSNDDINYIKIYSGIYPYYRAGYQEKFVIKLDKNINCRFIKINILDGYNSRTYTWTGIKTIEIKGQNKLFIINKDNMNYSILNSFYDNNLDIYKPIDITNMIDKHKFFIDYGFNIDDINKTNIMKFKPLNKFSNFKLIKIEI